MSEWMPIESAPKDTDILCYCADYEPHNFVGRYALSCRVEQVLVSESSHPSGKRRIYEERTFTERDWGNTESWGATHWMPLPEPPQT